MSTPNFTLAPGSGTQEPEEPKTPPPQEPALSSTQTTAQTAPQVPSGHVSSDDDDEVDLTAGGKKKPTKGRKKGPVKQELIPTQKLRTQCARRSGASLVKQIQEYEVKTNSKVFLQTEYKGGRAPVSFIYGTPFPASNEEEGRSAALAALKEELFEVVAVAVGGAVEGKIVPLLEEVKDSLPVAGPSTLDTSLSPQKRIGKAKQVKANECGKCGREKVVKDFIAFESGWIGCSQPECNKWFHSDCLGFPGVTEADVQTMPNYFCPDHISFGRKQKKVGNEYLEPEPETAKAAKQQAKKGKKK